ncbi:hypothetical protein BDW62DRAFT_56495 [Aspergillus aurantiobrunneus]
MIMTMLALIFPSTRSCGSSGVNIVVKNLSPLPVAIKDVQLIIGNPHGYQCISIPSYVCPFIVRFLMEDRLRVAEQSAAKGILMLSLDDSSQSINAVRPVEIRFKCEKGSVFSYRAHDRSDRSIWTLDQGYTNLNHQQIWSGTLCRCSQENNNGWPSLPREPFLNRRAKGNFDALFDNSRGTK